MELIELREWSLDICKDTEMRARIRGVQGMMATFPFYFGCTLGAFILKHTDNLSLALQGSSMSAAQGQQVAEEVCKTVSRDRSEAVFDLFWTRLLKRKSEVDAVAEPQLPRKRRTPARQEAGDSGTHYFPSTPKEYFHHMYYAAIDVTTECIRPRFSQKDFKVYQSIQELLLKAVAGEDHDEELVQAVVQALGPAVPASRSSAGNGFDTSRFHIADLLDFFQSRGNARKLLLSEICTLGKLMLVMQATNAVSERSFSDLKQVKTYLRSTTGEGRLCLPTRNWQMAGQKLLGRKLVGIDNVKNKLH
ncbi:zinc finger MYM-type protein 1-like [Acropora palmata]|uniref:zinc finger MYM-type protein 1-like n=1 Tax=Acropora palmata TaxID=6131 RepID=UPI003DA07321